jgi:hypothetical protein
MPVAVATLKLCPVGNDFARASRAVGEACRELLASGHTPILQFLAQLSELVPHCVLRVDTSGYGSLTQAGVPWPRVFYWGFPEDGETQELFMRPQSAGANDVLDSHMINIELLYEQLDESLKNFARLVQEVRDGWESIQWNDSQRVTKTERAHVGRAAPVQSCATLSDIFGSDTEFVEVSRWDCSRILCASKSLLSTSCPSVCKIQRIFAWQQKLRYQNGQSMSDAADSLCSAVRYVVAATRALEDEASDELKSAAVAQSIVSVAAAISERIAAAQQAVLELTCMIANIRDQRILVTLAAALARSKSASTAASNALHTSLRQRTLWGLTDSPPRATYAAPRDFSVSPWTPSSESLRTASGTVDDYASMTRVGIAAMTAMVVSAVAVRGWEIEVVQTMKSCGR